ncbi:hypothetical protein [Citricoccus sp. K5]|uniref:hypothetical protein n=1 Tax=Citricoccus sp. K5 TaxID=2653135 RepID=UPI0012F383C4|nr:hypothetical protein [Citricoccus sp. K5]VXC01063.1 hypothetical protein CITRIK5_70489 [Citricoccus sp. K5]
MTMWITELAVALALVTEREPRCCGTWRKPHPNRRRPPAPSRGSWKTVGTPWLAPPEDLQYFVEDKGHGCLDGFEVLRGPETMMMSGAPGVHCGYDYEYASFNDGGPVRGWAWVAYSPDGRKHHIFMTAYEEVWTRDHQILQAVAASVAVPQ